MLSFMNQGQLQKLGKLGKQATFTYQKRILKKKEAQLTIRGEKRLVP